MYDLLFIFVCFQLVGSTVSFDIRRTNSNFLRKYRIIGGTEAVPHAYPYQAAILIDGIAFCGGSLISPNYVLTAAHCAIEIYSSAEIILGVHNNSNNEPTQFRTTFSKITVHRNFNYTNFQNDIALLKLLHPAPITTAIHAVQLISRNDSKNRFLNKTVTCTGWGLIHDVFNPSIKDMSSVLRVVNVPVIELSKCKDYYKNDFYIDFITDNNICTSGDQKKGTCDGDSGGPLVLNGVQIGIVAAGTSLCEIGAPSVFTHVGKYLDWIESNSDVILS